jgi:hypothetical protein
MSPWRGCNWDSIVSFRTLTSADFCRLFACGDSGTSRGGLGAFGERVRGVDVLFFARAMPVTPGA